MLMVKKIVLSMAAILLACASVLAQNQQVSGTVTGTDGLPVIGATVVVEGTTLGTSTDLQGNYTLAAPTNGVLVFSFIGYEDAKLAINGKTTVNVTLKEASKSIDEVIVVAFGEAKKDAFTGSAKVVSSEDLSKTQSTNVSDALVGKVAGMQMSQTSGRPGSQQSITIRGVGSVNAGTQPLWVVDGMPYDGDINNINPADIENISVLKDAASNALYGARGANGVIMVTTKRAKMGDARIVFDGKWGLNTRALRTYDYVDDAGEYYELHYRSLYNYYLQSEGMSPTDAYKSANKTLTSTNNGGLGYNVMTVPAGQYLIGSNGRLNPYATEGRLVTMEDGTQYWVQPDDWLNELYHPGFRQEYNVNVSAASEKSNFFASFGYLDNEGIVDGSSNERYTARLRADYQAKKWLKLGGNFAYTNYTWRDGNGTEGETGGGNVFATALQTAPIYPIYIRDGKGNLTYDKWGYPVYDIYNGANAGMKRTSAYLSNEMQDIQLNKYIDEGNQFSAGGFAEFRLYRDLKFTFNASSNIDETRSTAVLNPYYGQFAPEGGQISKSHSRLVSYNLQQLLNYTHSFNGLHNVDVLLGHEMYDLKQYGLSAAKSKMFSYNYTELSGAVVDKQSASSSLGQYNTEGYFLRAQYDYDQRVFASVSYRRDASSKFHPDHRWGNFWSLSAAWLINRESWFNVKWVDLLKLKASYGSQGNDNIGSYRYIDLYTISNDGQGGIATIFAQKGNPNITWETNGNLNLGVEFGLFNNRIYGNIDYFYRKTTDMLFSLKVAPSNGYSAYYTNIGDMANQGIEIELGGDIMRRKNFVWSAGLNMTHYKNKIVRLPEQYKENVTSDGKVHGYVWGSTFLAEGYAVNTMYYPTYAGVDSEGKATWYTYATDENTGAFLTDKNGDRIRVVTDDYSKALQYGRELQGDPTPKLYGGFNTSLQFYGVDVSANFTYQIGGLVYDSGYAGYMSSPMGTTVGGNYHRDLLNAWSANNANSDIPRLQYGDEYTTAMSDRFLTDASYLNIQNITVGYTLPENITRKFLVSKLRVYVVCDNVWYWSRRKGLDPRQSMTGGSNNAMYCPVRTISGGINVTF